MPTFEYLTFVPGSNRIGFRRLDPKRLELGQVLGHGIVEVELPFLHENGDRHAAEAFRLRTLHIDVVQGDRTLGVGVGIAETGRLLDTILVEHADGPGQLAGINILLERVLRE